MLCAFDEGYRQTPRQYWGLRFCTVIARFISDHLQRIAVLQTIVTWNARDVISSRLGIFYAIWAGGEVGTTWHSGQHTLTRSRVKVPPRRHSLAAGFSARHYCSTLAPHGKRVRQYLRQLMCLIGLAHNACGTSLLRTHLEARATVAGNDKYRHCRFDGVNALG